MLRHLDATAHQAAAILQTLPRADRFNLATRAGWNELLEATWSQRFMNDLTPEKLSQLRSLCGRWQRQFYELQFTALTRPVWNT